MAVHSHCLSIQFTTENVMYKAHVFHTTIIDFDQSQKYENKQNMIHLLKTNIHKQVML